MKTKSILMLMLGLTMAVTAHAADGVYGHDRGDGRGGFDYGDRKDNLSMRIADEARRLDDMTRRGARYPQVRDAVSRFEYSAEDLYRCESRNDSSYPRPMPGRDRDRYASRSCDREVYGVLTQFAVVQYYLYDTYIDAPMVYDQYQRLNQTVEKYLNVDARPGGGGGYPGDDHGGPGGGGGYPGDDHGGPGGGGGYPGDRRMSADGYMDNLAFHFVGKDALDIRAQCQSFVQQYRIGIVSCLLVNSAKFGTCAQSSSMTNVEACAQVGLNARQN